MLVKGPPWGLMWSWKYHHLFPASASKRHQIPMKMQWCHIEYITGYATMHFTGVWWMQPSSTYKQCLILLISTDWSIKASILYSDIMIYISFFMSHYYLSVKHFALHFNFSLILFIQHIFFLTWKVCWKINSSPTTTKHSSAYFLWGNVNTPSLFFEVISLFLYANIFLLWFTAALQSFSEWQQPFH